jgi:dipeptidyl aminopeptidase/acylaminoacyl peptidase
MSEAKRVIRAEDLYHLKIVSDPQISPDGEHIIFCVQHVDEKTEKKSSNFWLVATDNGDPRQFTYGDQSDRHPRWSPNGQEIAFLSNRKDEKQEQLHIIPFHGGEARSLTEFKGSFASFEWSPDGAQIVCQFRKKDEETLEREEDEQKKKLGIVARQITSLEYKMDGAGYLPQEKWHIWTVDTTDGDAQQLTAGSYDETEPRWSPDGQQILFISNRSEDPAQETDADDLYLVTAAEGKMQLVKTRYCRKFLPSFSPDGQWIAYLGRAQTGRFYQNSRLYIVPTAGGDSRNLSAAFDLNLSIATITDTVSGTPQTPPTWSRDGRFIFCQATERGNQPLLAFAVNPDADSLTRVIDGAGVVGGFSLDAEQQKIAYLWGTLDRVEQVLLHEQESGQSRPLSSFNKERMESLNLGQVEAVTFSGSDGVDLPGWILKPPGFDPAQTYPSILEIHGGPQTQYGHAFMHEFYYLAAQGYVVYWCNPRGSQGYGEDFAAAIYNQWGSVDYDDLMAWADYLEQQPYIDPERMGVTGGSYGGYMTTMIIGSTQRFKAAVAQRVVSNFISFYGSSDMNWLAEGLLGTEAPPWNDLENYWRQSPISRIGNATTPTLLIHSETDYRCDREQGEQVFVALKRLGVDTELILFPGESHGLSRNGRTDRRITRLNHMTRWFEKYLK